MTDGLWLGKVLSESGEPTGKILLWCETAWGGPRDAEPGEAACLLLLGELLSWLEEDE